MRVRAIPLLCSVEDELNDEHRVAFLEAYFTDKSYQCCAQQFQLKFPYVHVSGINQLFYY